MKITEVQLRRVVKRIIREQADAGQSDDRLLFQQIDDAINYDNHEDVESVVAEFAEMEGRDPDELFDAYMNWTNNN